MSSDENGESVLAELSDLQSVELGGGQEVARVKKRGSGKVKQQKWTSDDSAEGLLAGLLGEAEVEAEQERRRVEQQLKAREEQARLKREEEERQKREKANRELEKERKRAEEVGIRRTQMMAAIEREKKIESGEINEEEEARKKAEAEAKKRREEEERRQKEQALAASQALIAEQQQKIEQLANRPVEQHIVEQRSQTGLIVAIAALIVAAIGGVAAFLVLGGSDAAAEDPLAITSGLAVPSVSAAVAAPASAMYDVGIDVVSQKAGMRVETIAASDGAGASADKGSGRSSSSSRNKSKSSDKSAPKKSQFGDLGSTNVLGGGKGGGIIK